MRSGRPTPLGRLALVLVLVGLLLTLAGMTYVMFVRWRTEPSVTLPDGTSAADAANRLRLVLALLLVSVLAIIGLVVGTYLVINMGKSLNRNRLGEKPTEYVDAWSRYRLSQADLDAADRLLGGDSDGDNRGESGDNSASSDPREPRDQ